MVVNGLPGSCANFVRGGPTWEVSWQGTRTKTQIRRRSHAVIKMFCPYLKEKDGRLSNGRRTYVAKTTPRTPHESEKKALEGAGSRRYVHLACKDAG